MVKTGKWGSMSDLWNELKQSVNGLQQMLVMLGWLEPNAEISGIDLGLFQVLDVELIFLLKQEPTSLNKSDEWLWSEVCASGWIAIGGLPAVMSQKQHSWALSVPDGMTPGRSAYCEFSTSGLRHNNQQSHIKQWTLQLFHFISISIIPFFQTLFLFSSFYSSFLSFFPLIFIPSFQFITPFLNLLPNLSFCFPSHSSQCLLSPPILCPLPLIYSPSFPIFPNILIFLPPLRWTSLLPLWHRHANICPCPYLLLFLLLCIFFSELLLQFSFNAKTPNLLIFSAQSHPCGER